MIFWLLTTIILFLFVLIVLLQTPAFQNFVGEKVLGYLNDNTRQTAKFTNIEIKWFDFVELKDLELRDYNGKVMISASKIAVDYELNKLLVDGNISFDHVSIVDGGLFISKYRDSLSINLVEFIQDLNSLNRKPRDSSAVKSPRLSFKTINLEQFQFSYNNQLSDSLPKDKFDYNHFVLEIPGANFSDFSIYKDSIQARINSLIAVDWSSGLTVNNLTTDFLLCSSGMSLTNLNLETKNSLVRDKVALTYSGMEDLGYFTDSVTMDINLVNSRLSKYDLDFFTDIPTEHFDVRVTTSLYGPVGRMSFSDLDLFIGESTNIKANIDFTGLPKIEETFIDARVKQASLDIDDLAPFIHDETSNQLGELTKVGFSGNFLGFTHDFVANAQFETSLGNLSSDINLKFPKGWESAKYSGKLNLEKFDIGQLLKEESVGVVNLKGNIDGQGITQSDAKFFLNAELYESEFFGYTFDNIVAKGQFATEFFKGSLEVLDPNCRISTTGNVNLASVPEEVNVESKIENIDFLKLGLYKDTLRFSGEINADFTSLNLDSLQGALSVRKMDLKWRQDSIHLDSIAVSSYANRRQRSINVDLPDVSASLEGDFYFSQLSKDIQLLVSEVEDYFDPDYSQEQITSREAEIQRYSIDFQVTYRDISRYLALLNQDIYLSPSGTFEGTYYQRRNATLSLFTEIDSINYNGVGYNNNVIDLNFSKDLDSAGIIASIYLNSREQVWRNIPNTKDFSLEAVWFNNRINVTSNIIQPDNNSSAHINGELKLLDDRLIFSFLPSKLIVFGDQWFFNPFNKIIYTQSEITVDRLELYQNAESILLTGVYADSSETDLTLDITDFSLKNLTAVVPFGVEGLLNSSVKLTRPDLSNPFVLNSSLKVDSLSMNAFPIGDVTGKSQWNPNKRRLELDFKVQRERIKTVDISGYYMPEDSLNQLDIKAKFNQASLQLLNPFFSTLISDIGGVADGELDVSGRTSSPVLVGAADVDQGRFTFDYLGTTYDFSGNVSLDNKSINFNGIRLMDKDGDRASFSGSVYHKGFKDISTDLSLSASNFLFLNTNSQQNSLYYGTANATGKVTITGPVEDLVISAKATTEKGTKIYIPLSGSQEITQKDYISFVDLTDTTSSVDIEEFVRSSISGVRLDFEIDVTPDAYVELIFDIRTGDIIRGRGNGNLNLSLDTNGEFELFGDINITEGAYNFTIPNLINKEFSVVPGSTISWYGDPYAGILNLSATYRQLASFNEYNGTDDTGVTQKYPVLVVLNLKGEMLSPSIDFEIKLEDSQSSPTTEAQEALSSINSNEQELKRQVFSLLILRKISPPNDFEIGGSGAVTGSLSEFLSNQFSYFISQADENLEVDVDLASLDQDAYNTFQLRLSYTFLDGRLRVSGGGGVPQNGADEASGSDFVGDWSVRYLLTKDGHLRVKAFSQSEQIANSLQRETGVSFQYIKSFSDFRELVSKTREENIQTKPKDMEKEREANAVRQKDLTQ